MLYIKGNLKMKRKIDFISIDEIVSRVKDHPMMTDFDKEKAIRYMLEFTRKMDMHDLYVDVYADVLIVDYRGLIPCNIVAVEQVMDEKSGLCLRAMLGSFNEHGEELEPSFKVKGSVIFCSMREGVIRIAGKGLPVDDDGFPMVPDDDLYLKTLESYIKENMFTVLFDLGKIAKNVLDNAKQDYCFNVAQLSSRLSIPDINEMESIVRGNRMIVDDDEFSRGFSKLGNKEYRKHF